MDASQAGRRGSKRARVSAEVASHAGGSSACAGASTSDRPTPAELQEALNVIKQMKQMEPPLISRRGQPPKPNIVACALALQRGERFSDDREALRLFGAHPETKVREEWVNGKLAQFAPAGLSTAGEQALPAYLLNRGEAHTASESALPYLDMQALRERWCPSQAALDSEEAAEADDSWMRQCVDVIARRFRAYNDGRAARPSPPEVLSSVGVGSE